MIKLERGACPKELTEEVKQELTKLYKEDNEKDVWNSPKIKTSLKKALTDMTHNKCAYCECKLNIESKDVTIDHFLPKVDNESLVVEWGNLLPSCLRCNRAKNRSIEEIINPCNIDPKLYIGVKSNSFRLIKIGESEIGKNTIRVLKLNDIDRVLVARMRIIEKIIETLSDLLEDVEELEKISPKYVSRFEGYLSEALNDKEYSAVASAKILDDDVFKKLKNLFIEKKAWNIRLIKIEEELQKIALKIV